MNKSNPVRILYFSNEAKRVGAQEHLLQLLRRLDRGVFEPHLACTPEMASRLKSEIPADVTVHPIKLCKPTHLRGATRLVGLLRRHKIDILHAHTSWASLHAMPLARLVGVPVTIETPDLRELRRTGPTKSKAFVDRAIGRLVDYYVAVSEASRKDLVSERRVPAHKVILIPNGTDLERFASPPEFPIRRTDLGLRAEDRVLAVFARLEPEEGHRVLLDALPGALREVPNVKVICVGDGPLRKELVARVRDLGLQDDVRFVGFQTDTVAWLHLVDATVLPSSFEGLALAAIESLAAGKPMIASAVDGVSEVVLDGVTGLTVAPGDARALKEAICTLLRSPELLQKLGAAGRRWVCENFDVRKQVQSTEELYLRAWQEKTSHKRVGVKRSNGEMAQDRSIFEVRT